MDKNKQQQPNPFFVSCFCGASGHLNYIQKHSRVATTFTQTDAIYIFSWNRSGRASFYQINDDRAVSRGGEGCWEAMGSAGREPLAAPGRMPSLGLSFWCEGQSRAERHPWVWLPLQEQMDEFCASAHERDWRAERGFTWIAFTQPADLQKTNTSDVSKKCEGLFMLSMWGSGPHWPNWF